MIRKILKFTSPDGHEKRVPFEDLIPKAHQYIFAFAAKDIDEIINKAEEYLGSHDAGEDLLSSILSDIQSLHPVYDDSTAVISLLARTGAEYIRLRGEGTDSPVAEKLEEKGIADRGFLDSCISSMEGKTGPVPDSLYSLKEVQEEIRIVLSAVLDKSDAHMETADSRKRNILACLLCERWARFVDRKDNGGSLCFYIEKGTVFPDASSIPGLNIARDVKAIGARKNMKTLPLSVKDLLSLIPDSESGIEWQYDLPSTESLFETELLEMVRDEVPVKRCRKCGKYFVYEPDGYEYCIIKRDDGGSCYSDNMKFVGNMLYKKAYRALYQMLLRDVVKKKWFDIWHERAKKYINEEVDYTTVSEKEISKHFKDLVKEIRREAAEEGE